MPDYAAIAAAHLDRVAKSLDNLPGVTPVDAAWMRLEIAREYTRLAAIGKGLPPGCGHTAEPPAR
jgi:hypothetical protein